MEATKKDDIYTSKNVGSVSHVHGAETTKDLETLKAEKDLQGAKVSALEVAMQEVDTRRQELEQANATLHTESEALRNHISALEEEKIEM